MTSLRYILRGSSSPQSISLRLNIGSGRRIEKKTGLRIEVLDWDKESALPISRNQELQDLTRTLESLRKYIIDGIELSGALGKTVNTFWLSDQINIFFNRSSEEQKITLVTNLIEKFVEDSDKPNAYKKDQMSLSRYREFKQLLRHFSNFQGRKRYHVRDIDRKTGLAFYEYLCNTCNYSPNYSKKLFSNLKSICYYGESKGMQISPQLRGLSIQNEAFKPGVYLDNNDLKAIEEARLTTAYLINARKWLLLGCHTGLRAKDLLILTDEQIDHKSKTIKLTGIDPPKSKKKTIPILPRALEVIDNGLPHRISLVNLNLYIKEVCLKAGLTGQLSGKVYDSKTGRKLVGRYPKYRLISTDVFRRSFCHNYYGILDTLSIMKICGLKTEKALINFMGRLILQ